MNRRASDPIHCNDGQLLKNFKPTNVLKNNETLNNDAWRFSNASMNGQIFTSRSSAFCQQEFETFDCLNTTPNWICPLHPIIHILEPRKKLTTPLYRKLSLDSVKTSSGDISRKSASECPHNTNIGVKEQNFLHNRMDRTNEFQSATSPINKRIKAKVTIVPDEITVQWPYTARKFGMAKPKNPFYEVSNRYVQEARYNQLFSIKKSKLDNQRNDVEKGEANCQSIPVGNVVSDNGFQNHCKDVQGNVYGRSWRSQSNLKRFKLCKQFSAQKTRACNFCLLFAVVGVAFTILEAELVANKYTNKLERFSMLLRYVIVFTTLILLLCIIWYHTIEIKMYLNDNGVDDWRVAITADRVLKLCAELLICSVCPFPNAILINWTVLLDDHRQIHTVQVPLDIVLSIPMFLRCYLLCRFVVLHSHQFQDAATRSIASLNRVTLNFSFVLKTLIHEHPLLILCSFTITFCVLMAWLLTQCERFDGVIEDNHYLNALWFIIITFKSVGYGDLVPNTYCGRVLAITTGIVGAVVSSTLIAIIGMKLELSRAEKHVNNFMTDSKLTRLRKERAAMVLQHTWFIHKYRRLQSAKDEIKLRSHQRKFLAAINEFRKVKWGQRKLAEQGNALIDLAKLQSDMHTMIWSMQQSLDNLTNQMSILTQRVNGACTAEYASKDKAFEVVLSDA